MIDLTTEIDLTTRIVVAIVLGGVIGLEREIKGHVAGLRTNMLICLGSALFMITGELVTRQFVTLTPAPDPTRIGSTIVTGVGFLGAGIIFQGHGRVRNLTTAATIWVIAAIGMLAGAGIYIVATTATVITLLVLTVLTRLEDWMVQHGIAASDESANATETPVGPPPGA